MSRLSADRLALKARGFASSNRRALLAASTIVILCAAALLGWHVYSKATTTTVTAYFANTNGLYAGDTVKIMGVEVGKVGSITAAGDKMKVELRVDSSHPVPGDAKAVILSPTLVSARSIQLAPAYTGGPKMKSGDNIPIERTAVPVEWDDFRAQLEQLTSALSDTTNNPDGPLGEFVDSAASALDDRGNQINDTLGSLSKATTTLSDGRDDLFATVRNLQVFVSALATSDQQMAQFNQDLASVTSVLSNSDNELGNAMNSVNEVLGELEKFVADNRDQLSTSVERLSRVTTSLQQSQPDIEQLLHVGPTAFSNFYNIYQPAQGTLTGALAVTQFQNPIQFICGAIQAASGEGAEVSAQRCAQHLGPVLKNLQFNYPPVGINPIKGVQLRPEQIDYSEAGLKPPAGQTNTSVPGVFEPADTPRSQVQGGSGLRGLMQPAVVGGPR
ncbi:MCE family protein [Williamsia sp. DF01-3]|uniref:MCE family protein n=1 Tax=Williamsia sp. DF01-3 TaxID=2934157 RepID=UPI001FF2DDD1|nr:MCE family protein [Williamsia sp. DF01-3]MCK0517364.1 MCE family protein [Williamsia sp. DF01-3]